MSIISHILLYSWNINSIFRPRVSIVLMHSGRDGSRLVMHINLNHNQLMEHRYIYATGPVLVTKLVENNQLLGALQAGRFPLQSASLFPSKKSPTATKLISASQLQFWQLSHNIMVTLLQYWIFAGSLPLFLPMHIYLLCLL